MQLVILGDRMDFGLEPATAKVFDNNLAAQAYLKEITNLDHNGTKWYGYKWHGNPKMFSKYLDFTNISITSSEKFMVVFFDKNGLIPFSAHFFTNTLNLAHSLVASNYLQTNTCNAKPTYVMHGKTYYDYEVYQIQPVDEDICIFEGNKV